MEGTYLWASFGRKVSFTPLLSTGRDTVTDSEAATWLGAQERWEWFGEHPASLCCQNLLKVKCSLRGGQGRRPGGGGCGQGLETQSWGCVPGRDDRSLAQRAQCVQMAAKAAISAEPSVGGVAALVPGSHAGLLEPKQPCQLLSEPLERPLLSRLSGQPSPGPSPFRLRALDPWSGPASSGFQHGSRSLCF